MDQAVFAEKIRDLLMQAAKDAYEEAGVMGLCAEGRWENALGAMQAFSLNEKIYQVQEGLGKNQRAAKVTLRKKRATKATRTSKKNP
ncbi:MAG: hypothetical protein LDLANPLL_00610 [Turneriella sp.]|nr:hypothetical protein [Turneriella sp.]